MMKRKNKIILIAIFCFCCIFLITGCRNKVKDDNPREYSITVSSDIENGSVVCNQTEAKAGDVISFEVKADDCYEFVNATVNGNAISGNSFVMPEEDVQIGAFFKVRAELICSIPDGASVVTASSVGGAVSKGHMLLRFTENGIIFNAYVEDKYVVQNDGAAILFSKEQPTINSLLPNGETIKVSMNGLGELHCFKTDAEGALKETTLDGVESEFSRWSVSGDKIDGYRLELFVPYTLLGVTRESAKGNITVCPVIYNAYGTLPANGASLDGIVETAQNTYAVFEDDNTYRANKYVIGSAQFGSCNSVSAGQYWDLSKDYYEDDEANYPNREVTLTGHDKNDNNLVFNRVSANEMYVKATFSVIGVTNKNDKWPKFGLMLFDGSGKSGLFLYVDSYMSSATNNTADDIVGTNIGINRGRNNEYGSWIVAKENVFDLDSKTITLEMVYQNGWVHIYADGEYIRSLYYGSYNENLHFGIKSFGIDLKITDYLASDDSVADGWEDKKLAYDENMGNVFKNPTEDYMTGIHWDLSNDTSTSSGAVSLKSHDYSDNYLFFNVSSPDFMYASANIKLTDYLNKGDKYLKFGLSLFDGTESQLFFYVDSYAKSSSAANKLSDIQGNSYGVVILNAESPDNYCEIVNVKKTFNLNTYTVKMELVYIDGYVYFFADSTLIARCQYMAKTDDLYIAIKNFGFGMEVSDYYCTDNLSDSRISDVIGKLPMPKNGVIDGIVDENDLYFNPNVYVEGTVEKGVTVRYYMNLMNDGLYLTTYVYAKELPQQHTDEDGWWTWNNIEYLVNDVQTYVAIGGQGDSKDDCYYVYCSSNIDMVAATINEVEDGYLYVIEAYIDNISAIPAVTLNWTVWDGIRARP